MATSSTSSTLGSSDETFNGTKLMRLILDGGTEALRNAFRKIHSGKLQVVLSSNQHILSKLRPKIVNQNQWDKLYPVPPNQPNISDFDITLLSVLLRNICSLPSPCSGWDNMPNVSDHSVEADIVRIKLFRNVRFAHISNTAVSTAEFKASCAELCLPLVRLGIDQKEIDRLENEECEKDEKERVLKEWNEWDNKIMNVLEDIKDDVKALVIKDEESRSDSVLNKHLVWCDFQREIELYQAKFTKGTREWVFDQVFNWFNDETSENRAFVISGLAGMGKSVIAAVICKRFAEHVGASHFFQYHNSQYNNPNFLLQSLAWQVSKVVVAYKEALIEKLSGNLGQSLNNMNTEGLFSILFKEPFSGIADPGKRILIVLDAVDESDYYGRDELANLISNHLHRLPSYIRFVITTRPEENLLDKFKELNPLYIEASDERNLNDLKLVLQERISSANTPTADLINSLAEKSDGLMIYAFFLSEIYNESSMHSIDSLPRGVEEYYKSYFQRLEHELNLLEISEHKFLFFLSALAVANEPLPEAYVGILFGFENSPRAKRKIAKAINCLSSLLVIKEDKSISFFHKSIRDWLVDNSEHDYFVDVQCGHKILFDLCVKTLNDLKKELISNEGIVGAALKYALKHCIPHMLNGLKDAGKVKCFVSDYVADLEVMFASVCVNVDLTLSNITSLTNHDMYKHVSENTRTMLSRLLSLTRKYSFFLRDHPQTFLQNVVNECEEQLSLKASALLETRYKDIVYLEAVKKDRKNDALEVRFLLSGKISGIDISPKHDYVVCSYKFGGVELFSLVTGNSEWKIQDFWVKIPTFPLTRNDICDSCMLPHCIVFHPRESLILPGRLDKVLTLQGTFATGPFQSDEDSSVFTNCCFSLDSSRMVTNYGNQLIVWNVLSGSKEKCLPCKMLVSLSFTVSGNFLGTTDIENLFTVYDVTNDYNGNSKRIDSETPVEIVSTFDENSWFCSVRDCIQIVNHVLFLSSASCSIREIVLPSNVYSSHELHCFLQHPVQSWFSKVKKGTENFSDLLVYTALRYFLIRDKRVLIFSCSSNTMRVFSIQVLIDTEQQAPVKKFVISEISTNGDFVYLNDMTTKILTICKLDSKNKYSKPCKALRKAGDLSFLVVRDGVVVKLGSKAPRLWNCHLTQVLAKFDQLVGLRQWMTVSDEIIAYVHETGHIYFFNVFTKQIVHRIRFREDVLALHACSIKYYVCGMDSSHQFCLWNDAGKVVNGWRDYHLRNISLQAISAKFSPDGNRLALTYGTNRILIFDVLSAIWLAKICVYGPSDDSLWHTFFDNENILCGSTNHMSYFINVERGEILTCLDVGYIPLPISVCRKRSIVCAGRSRSENFELIKVCLPR